MITNPHYQRRVGVADSFPGDDLPNFLILGSCGFQLFPGNQKRCTLLAPCTIYHKYLKIEKNVWNHTWVLGIRFSIIFWKTSLASRISGFSGLYELRQGSCLVESYKDSILYLDPFWFRWMCLLYSQLFDKNKSQNSNYQNTSWIYVKSAFMVPTQKLFPRRIQTKSLALRVHPTLMLIHLPRAAIDFQFESSTRQINIAELNLHAIASNFLAQNLLILPPTLPGKKTPPTTYTDVEENPVPQWSDHHREASKNHGRNGR